eukprot:s1334_g9.t1
MQLGWIWLLLLGATHSEGEGGCQCGQSWEQIRLEMWEMFRPDLDLAGLTDCLMNNDCSDADLAAAAMLQGTAMSCSEEELPKVSSLVPCAAGFTHYMIACALQMWLKGFSRQSALYWEQGLGYLSLCLSCLDGSEWPLWSGQILENWQNFLRAAFPPAAVVAEERQSGDGTFLSVGPPAHAKSLSWWRTLPRRGRYCPPQGDHLEGLLENDGVKEPTVLCAVPLVWPGEELAAAAIVETYGPQCDRLVFFVASPNEATAAEAHRQIATLFEGAIVVNLAARWPAMLRDRREALASEGRRETSGANQKDLLLFEHLAASQEPLPDWVCRVETDSYFAAANFRRFVVGRNLSAEEPLYLGSLAYWQVHFEPRILYNEQVQCLSRAAVLRMGAVVKAAPKAEAASYARCEVAPGHRGDVMMGLCLAEAGIGPHPDVTDRWGREYFMNFRMEDMAAHAPDNAYGELMADPREITSNAAIHWRGKAHLFMPCLWINRFWASPLPISFHDYKDPEKLREVHEIMHGRQSCRRCPDGYIPRLAEEKQRLVCHGDFTGHSYSIVAPCKIHSIQQFNSKSR